MTKTPIKRDADFLPLEELKKVQQQRWYIQADYVKAHSSFYKQHLRNEELPQSLNRLERLPFTTKEHLRHDQQKHHPFGSYLAAEEKNIVRMHRTSGTSGTAMNLALTATDAQITAIVGGRAQRASGLTDNHRVVHCLNYKLWMGGFTDHTTLEETGAMVFPYGVGGTEGLIQLIQDMNINAISCTPSYPTVLEQVIETSFSGLRPDQLGLKLGLFGGEPGLDDPAFKQRLENTWGFQARNSNYGVTDVLCNFAGQTTRDNDLHFMAMDVLYPELIDPETGDNKLWKEGETGELVLTHLYKQAQPLIRFRTNDIIQLTGVDTASCGRTTPRFRVIGRSDDMIVVRGINVFPTMLASVINQNKGCSGEYRITLDQPPPYNLLNIEIERSKKGSLKDSLKEELEQTIKDTIGIRTIVKLLGYNSLPRTEGKTKRVIRNF